MGDEALEESIVEPLSVKKFNYVLEKFNLSDLFSFKLIITYDNTSDYENNPKDLHLQDRYYTLQKFDTTDILQKIINFFNSYNTKKSFLSFSPFVTKVKVNYKILKEVLLTFFDFFVKKITLQDILPNIQKEEVRNVFFDASDTKFKESMDKTFLNLYKILELFEKNNPIFYQDLIRSIDFSFFTKPFETYYKEIFPKEEITSVGGSTKRRKTTRRRLLTKQRSSTKRRSYKKKRAVTKRRTQKKQKK